MTSERDGVVTQEQKPYKAPSILSFAFTIGLATGSCGAFISAIVATLRNHPRKAVFITGTALNTFVIGSGFSVTRDLLSYKLFSVEERQNLTPSDRLILSTIAGATTGGIWGSIVGGRKHAISGFVVFGLSSLGGQFILNRQEALKKAPLDQGHDSNAKKEGIISRILGSQNSPIRRLSKEEYRDMLRDKQLLFDADIAIIEEELEKLYRELESQDPEMAKRLRERGYRRLARDKEK